MAGPTAARIVLEIGRMGEEVEALKDIWTCARRDERAAYRNYRDARREREALVEQLAVVDPTTAAEMRKGYGA